MTAYMKMTLQERQAEYAALQEKFEQLKSLERRMTNECVSKSGSLCARPPCGVSF